MVLLLPDGVGSAAAAAPETRGDVSPTGNNDSRTVTIMEHEPTGESVGDQQIGHLRLQDDSGSDAADLRRIATVVMVDAAAGDTKTSSMNQISLSGGVPPSVRRPKSTMADVQYRTERNATGDHTITGGSRVSCRGDRKKTSRAGKDTHVFEVSCD